MFRHLDKERGLGLRIRRLSAASYMGTCTLRMTPQNFPRWRLLEGPQHKDIAADFRLKTVKGQDKICVTCSSRNLLFTSLVLLFVRNSILEKMGARLPTARKTGTTICGIVFKVSLYLLCWFKVLLPQTIYRLRNVNATCQLYDHVLICSTYK